MDGILKVCMNILYKSFWILAVLLGFFLAGCTTSDGGNLPLPNNPKVSGLALVKQSCSLCHSMTGESISPAFPKLAGQQKEYLQLQLTDFKGHTRRDPTGVQYMWGVTRLTPDQMDTLSDYFSKQTPMQSASVSVSARGKEIFMNGLPSQGVVQCSACHGVDGKGNGAIPRLAGQHVNYLVKQIKVFKLTDERPRGEAMKQITHDLSDEDITEVAAYIASMGNL